MPENNGTNNANNQNLENNNNVGTGENGNGGNAATHTANSEGEGAKTFTQEEVNKMIQDRLAREKKGLPSDDELKKFKEWQDSQKTLEEKLQSKEAEIEGLKKQVTTQMNESKVLGANVQSQFAKFVQSEVTSMEGDFDVNLKKYLEENPQYLTSTKKTTGISMSGGNGGEEKDGVYEILKKKHPDQFKD